MAQKTVFCNSLVELAKVVRLLERKPSSAACNVGNWVTQLVGNDRVTNRVEIVAEYVLGKKISFAIENFQPARVIAKGYENSADSTPAELINLYESGNFPAELEVKEVSALIAYFTTLNMFGKPLSAASGGRALGVAKLLEISKPKSFLMTVKDVTVGGNKKDKYSPTLTLEDVTSMAKGELWRANLVLALVDGGKTSSGSNSVLAGWVVKS
jgi:hypothetical protein